MKTTEAVKNQIKFEDLDYKTKQKVIRQRQGMGIIVHTNNSGRQYKSAEETKKSKRDAKTYKKEQSRLAKIERRKKVKNI